MKPLYYLICIGLFILSSAFRNIHPIPDDDCKKVDAKTSITKSGDGLHSVTIELTKGDRNSVQYIFCEEKGKVLNEGAFKVNSIQSLKKGNYFCVVSTSDCAKKISFKIK